MEVITGSASGLSLKRLWYSGSEGIAFFGGVMGISRLDSNKEISKIPYMVQSTLTSKNQTTIPKAVIEALNLEPSDQLVYEFEEDGRIVLSAKTGTFASVASRLPRKAVPGKIHSTEEMTSAVKEMARKRFLRANG